MTDLKSKSVFNVKRPMLWLVLVIAVACFADWTQNRFDQKRSEEIKASMPPGSHLRISGSGPPSSTEMLLQLRYTAGMLEPTKSKSKTQQSAFIFGNNSSDNEDQDFDRRGRSTYDRLSGSRTGMNSNGFGNGSSQFSNNPFSSSQGNSFSPSSSNPFSASQSNPYSPSQNSTFAQDPTRSQGTTRRDNDSSTSLFGSSPN